LEKKKIILDTDVGTDFDDAFALTLAANSPELDLLGVTTVTPKGYLRARIGLKLLKMLYKERIPMVIGAEEPLLRELRPWWTTFHHWGHEGEGFLTPEDEKIQPTPGYGPDFIVEKVMQYPGEITLIPIGPLTNIALAIIREPQIIGKVKEIIAMGGVMNPQNLGLKPNLEHNFTSDPDAAKVVLNSGIPFKMVPLDVTIHFVMTRERFQQLKSIKTTVTEVLVIMTERWLKVVKRDWSELHDPLAVAYAVDPSFLQMKKYHIAFEMKNNILYTIPYERSELTPEFAPTVEPHIEVAVDVDSDRCWKFFIERIGK
jgi:purine nucleosidase